MNRAPIRTTKPLVVMTLSAIFLVACPKEWHIAIVGMEDAMSPVFCVSELSNCSGSGVGLSEFFLAAVDDAGNYTDAHGIKEPMWIIEPAKDVVLNRFTYGIVPDGWRETLASKPLRIGQWYTVGTHYFKLQRVGNEIQAEMLEPEEFQNRLNR